MKLIKKKDNWYNLYEENIGIGSTYEELQGYKLSLENCQEIESTTFNLGLNNTFNREGFNSLMKNEWNVEIITEPYYDGEFINDSKTYPIEIKFKPKLDNNGCIILKRID